MAVLILAKHDNASLNDATAKTVTAAKAMGGDITVLVAGNDCAAVAEAAAKLDGVAKVIHVEGEGYGHRLAEPLTDLVRGMAGGYEHIVFPATTSGKNVAPRLAALLDVMVISDITGVVGPDTFERPIYAGNAVQTVQSSDAEEGRHRPRRELRGHGRAGRRRRSRPPPAAADPGLSSWVEDKVAASDRPELTRRQDRRLRRPRRRVGGELRDHREARRQARRRRRRLARGGRLGLRAERLAGRPDRQGGGARALHRRRHLRRDPAPRRHEGLKVIVAINKDEEAPIFQVADYGLVGDLFQIVPELEKKLG